MFLLVLGLSLPIWAQGPTPDSVPDGQNTPQAVPAPAAKDSTLKVEPGSPAIKNKDLYEGTGYLHPFVRMPLYVLRDQKDIWTSPFHSSRRDIKWWALFGGATVGLIAADKSIQKALPTSSTIVSVNNHASNIGSAYSLIPISAAFYFIGTGTHHERFRETGLLGFEALIDTSLAVEAIKLVADRSRPNQDAGKGRFEDATSRWSSGFPSGHAISSWALASIVAHEYPHPLIIPITAYALATTVVVARVGARQHFPGDVVAGSAMGWFIGDFVYGKRHNDALDGKTTITQKILNHIQLGGD
jgi:membrane-associated phospholipid phosphatase